LAGCRGVSGRDAALRPARRRRRIEAVLILDGPGDACKNLRSPLWRDRGAVPFFSHGKSTHGERLFPLVVPRRGKGVQRVRAHADARVGEASSCRHGGHRADLEVRGTESPIRRRGSARRARLPFRPARKDRPPPAPAKAWITAPAARDPVSHDGTRLPGVGARGTSDENAGGGRSTNPGQAVAAGTGRPRSGAALIGVAGFVD